MKVHRITTTGNSAAVTLAQDELDHLDLQRGDQVIISKASANRLIIRPHLTEPERRRKVWNSGKHPV